MSSKSSITLMSCPTTALRFIGTRSTSSWSSVLVAPSQASWNMAVLKMNKLLWYTRCNCLKALLTCMRVVLCIVISSQRVSFPNSFFADGSLTVFPDILLNHNGVIKYVDFGAAKVIARQGKTLVAATGTHGKVNKSMTGTPMYMSPEVIKGENPGRAGAVDVWSLGCVILEMATGRRPCASLD